MATLGVTYGSARQPRTFGARGSRSLASLYGDTSMAPMSSARPQTFASITRPISDVLNSAQVANRARLAGITDPAAPQSANPASLPTTADVLGSFAGYNATKDAPLPGAAGYTPPTTPTVSPAPSSTYQQTDLSADPILNEIKNIGRRSISDAATSRGSLSIWRNVSRWAWRRKRFRY